MKGCKEILSHFSLKFPIKLQFLHAIIFTKTLRHSHAFSQNHINCLHMYSYVFALSMDYTKSTKPLRNMMCEAEFLDLLLCQFKIK